MKVELLREFVVYCMLFRYTVPRYSRYPNNECSSRKAQSTIIYENPVWFRKVKEDNYKYLETLGMGVMIDKKMAGEVLVLCEELGLVYCSTSRVYTYMRKRHLFIPC